MRRLLPLAASVALLNGCASIAEGSGQNIHVYTQPEIASTCTVDNTRSTSSVTAPSPLTVKRSKHDLNVSCTSAGAQGSTVVESDLENWWWGNVALLSPLGFFIDGVSGAMWEYPKNVYVQMQQAGYSSAPAVQAAPSYDQAAPAPTTAPAHSIQAAQPVYQQPAQQGISPAPATVIAPNTPPLTTYYPPAQPRY